MRRFDFQWELGGKITTDVIEARTFISAMRKLEKIFECLPGGRIYIWDEHKIAWKVRT